MTTRTPPDAPATAAALFDELERLTADQHAALGDGDDERLLAVLAEKQRLLAAVDLPALLRAAPDGDVADLRDRLDALLCDEAEDLTQATTRRDELAGELAGLSASSVARDGYAGGEAAPTRLDVGG